MATKTTPTAAAANIAARAARAARLAAAQAVVHDARHTYLATGAPSNARDAYVHDAAWAALRDAESAVVAVWLNG